MRLSKLKPAEGIVDKKLTLILDKASQGLSMIRDELFYLMILDKEEELELLYKTANFLRQKHLGNSCRVHGIIEFSNYCSNSCLYCGISADVSNINRYRMTEDEIIENAWKAVKNYGFKALVLQSGEDNLFSVSELERVIKIIKNKMDVLIFISTGEIGFKGLQRLYNAGARGILMRFETGNPDIYSEIHPGQKLETRLDHLREAFRIGYLIVTGGLIGLPGQTKDDLLNDILLAKELHTEMYSFGPFIPHPDTPLSDSSPTDINTILKVLALTRIVDPVNAKILVTTGFETFDRQARQLGLMAGANSVMLNVTPEKYKRDYSIYPNRAHIEESLEKQIDETLVLLKSLGRAPTDIGIA